MKSGTMIGALLLVAGVALAQDDPAAGFRNLFIHDECLSENAQQPDTCLHARMHEKRFVFGGRPGVVYDVSLRVQGLFEPTHMDGGTVPNPAQPWFVIGGEDKSPDYSQWHIDVSEPAASYTLNNYPRTSHTIYKEDFHATIPVAAGANVVVQVIDGNDRQIDNGTSGKPDRRQILEGVTGAPQAGQMLRLDVMSVQAR